MNKKKIINFIVLFVAIVLVLFFTLKDDFNNIVNEISKVNIWVYILAIVLFLVSHIFKAIGLKTFINEYKPYSLKNAYMLTLISLFLNGVTPFQTGGQPFQIYLLKKDGVRISDSTNAMIKDFIAFQSAVIIIGISALVANNFVGLFDANKYLNVFIFLGFLINLVVLGLLIFIAVAKKTGYKIMNNIIEFIFKLKITKRFTNKKEKLQEGLKNFYKTSKEISKNKTNLVKGIILNILHLSSLYIVPVLVFKSIGVNISILESFTSVAFIMIVGNFIPIPGATGGAEYSFMQFFGKFISGPLLSSGMLLWRFATYFFGLIIGSITLFFKRGEQSR